MRFQVCWKIENKSGNPSREFAANESERTFLHAEIYS